jgi:hypothetical protein
MRNEISARRRCCRQVVSPSTGISSIKDGDPRLGYSPPCEVNSVSSVFFSDLRMLLRSPDVTLIAFAVDAVLQVLHFRRGISLYRLPLALSPASGLSCLPAGRILAVSDFCLGLVDMRAELLTGFLAGLASGTLQFCHLLFQVSNLVVQVVGLAITHYRPPVVGAAIRCVASPALLKGGPCLPKVGHNRCWLAISSRYWCASQELLRGHMCRPGPSAHRRPEEALSPADYLAAAQKSVAATEDRLAVPVAGWD